MKKALAVKQFYALLLTLYSTPAASMRIKYTDLTYNEKTKLVCVYGENDTVCYCATYNIDTCQLRAQTQTLQTPGSTYNVISIRPSKSQLRLLINRIRTFLVLNNFDSQSPALAHMNDLFYTITQ